MAWNIHDNLAVKIRDPSFIHLIGSHDVVMFQETWLRPTQEETLPLPDGYKIFSMSRPDSLYYTADHPWGGVAVVLRNSIACTVVTRLSSPDLLVLDMDDFFLICAYLLPVNSSWEQWSEVDPQILLAEAITACASVSDKPVVLMGDLNCRTANKQSDPLAGDLRPFPRLSRDDTTYANARGNWLVRTCTDNNLVILNGTSFESSESPGAFTSFQHNGNTVIDYAIISRSATSWLAERSLSIIEDESWSDHAMLRLVVSTPRRMGTIPLTQSKSNANTRRVDVRTLLREPTELDTLAHDAIHTIKTSEESTAALYGPVFFGNINPLSVYVSSSCSNAAQGDPIATFGVSWGRNNARNAGFHVDGAQTNTRAALTAILHVVRSADSTRPLCIYTTSKFVIRSFCYWAGDNHEKGWACAHGDVIKEAAELMFCRPAPVEFRFVEKSRKTPPLQDAYDLAIDARTHRNQPSHFERITPGPPPHHAASDTESLHDATAERSTKAQRRAGVNSCRSCY